MNKLQMLLVVSLVCDVTVFIASERPYSRYNPRPSAPSLYEDESEEEEKMPYEEERRSLSPAERAKQQQLVAEIMKRHNPNWQSEIRSQRARYGYEPESSDGYWGKLLERAASSEAGQQVSKAVARRLTDAILQRKSEPFQAPKSESELSGWRGMVSQVAGKHLVLPSILHNLTYEELDYVNGWSKEKTMDYLIAIAQKYNWRIRLYNFATGSLEYNIVPQK